MKTKEKVKQGKGSADHLMPLVYLFKFAWQAGWLGLSPGWLGLRPGWLGLRPGWMAQRGDVWMDRQTDGQTDGQTENLPMPQEFVPYWGRCPKI